MAELGIAASIVSVIQLAGTVTQYLVTVKGASRDRQKIYNELSSITSILFILKDQADEAEHDGSWDTTLRALDMPNGPLEQFQKALETLAAKLAPVDGLKKLHKSLMWPFQEKEIKDILSTIERQKTLFSLARQNDHLTLTKALKADFMRIQDGVDDIGNTITHIQISDHQNNIIRWLSAPDPSLNYNNALKARHVKTGIWLIGGEVFLRWTRNAGSFLWLYGIPGCGKTILSSTIIQYLLDHCRRRPGSAVLYFYFDFNESEKQRHENLLRSLISQLFLCQNSTSDLLDSLYKCGRQPTHQELLATLHPMMTASDEVFVIVDALDECTERPEHLSDIEEIMRWKDVHLHVLVTSRKEVDIEDSLEPLCDEGTSICIQSALVNADILTYVHDRLSEDRRFKRWRNHAKVQLEIETTLMEKADGMFRWAVCQLDTLGSCVTLPQLQKALKSLPKDLDGTYERTLCKIDDSNHAYALKILQWLTFSARPLTLEEIAEVIAIDVQDDPRFDPERRLPDPRDIMTICPSLITVDGEEVEDIYGNWYTPVRLAHFSVKEYLVSDRIRIGNASGYSIRGRESVAVILQDCLIYLLHCDLAENCTPQELSDASVSESTTSELGSGFPLARYAAGHWTQHAQMAERNSTFETSSLILDLLCSQGAAFETWMSLGKLNNYSLTIPLWLDREGLIKVIRSPLHYVSLMGLVEPARLLLDQGYDADAKVKTTFGEASVLCVACMGGHPLVVKMLLNSGAVIDDYNPNEIGTPLFQASYFSHEEVVRLLLDRRADANAQGGRFLTALQVASVNGQGKIVQLLLDNGADVHAEGGYFHSALRAASYRGSKEIVQLLIARGADANAQGGHYHSALRAASYAGQWEVVQLLLKTGADVNDLGGDYESALLAALSIGHKGTKETVRLLIEAGAEVNARPNDYMGNPLQAALRMPLGYMTEQIVRLLIENGADVNAQEGFYGNALQAASYVGDKAVVQTLIEKGADVNAQGGPYGNALQAASHLGSEERVQLLIEKGADVNTQGGPYGNALQAASYRGNKGVVQTLIEKGANVNARGGRYITALRAARKKKHGDVVQLLLDSGAVEAEDILLDGLHSKDGSDRNPHGSESESECGWTSE